MAQIMDTDALDPGGSGAALQLLREKALRDGEGPLRGIGIVNHGEILLHFIAEKSGHGDHPDALLGLGSGDDVFPMAPVVGLGDVDFLLFEIKIRAVQSQQFALPNAAPVEHLETVEGERLVHDGLGKFLIFLLGPDLHFRPVLLPDGTGKARRVFGQLVKADGVVEDGAQLVVQRLQIGLRIGRAPGAFLLHNLILPADHIHRGDVPHPQILEKRQDLFLNDRRLCLPGAGFQAAADVLFVDLVEVGKTHVQAGILPLEEGGLPVNRLPL